MKLIVGLGNPGKEYERTRHNVGFLLLDRFADKHGISFKKEAKFHAWLGEKSVKGNKLLLLKPQTFMNLSGKAVAQALSYYKLSLTDLLVLHDDLDLALGEIRYREKGSSGGHNGLNSIIEQLNTKDFARLKIGIGRPLQADQITEYVLGKFDRISLLELEQNIFSKGLEKIEKWLEGKHV